MESIENENAQIGNLGALGSEPATADHPTPKVRPKRNAVRNIVWNWLGVFADIGTSLILTPILIRQLGDETYGVWILIGAFSGYFGMLDLGLRSATGRFIALYSARSDFEKVQTVVSTSSLTLSGIGSIAFAGISLAAYFLPSLYSIPTEQVATAQWALVIVGGQLWLWFMLRIFDAILWARQRFDLLNYVDIPSAFARAGITWWLVAQGGGLISLAWVSLAAAAINGLVKCWFTFQELPQLRVRPSFVMWGMFRELAGFGFWNFLISAMSMARTQGLPMVVGAFVGLRFLGPFSIIMRLPSTANSILCAATGVFSPIAVSLHANQDHVRQYKLVIEGSRLSFSLGLYFMGLFAFLGGPLLSIWIRPDFADYAPVLLIVGIGELLPMAMLIPQGVLQAMAKHDRLAWLVITETIVSLAAAAALGNWLGLSGVAIAIAIAASTFRGLMIMRHISELLKISTLRMARQTFVAPLLSGAPALVSLYILTYYHAPRNWPELFAYTLGFSLLFGIGIAHGVVGWQQVQLHCRSVLEMFGLYVAEPSARNACERKV